MKIFPTKLWINSFRRILTPIFHYWLSHISPTLVTLNCIFLLDYWRLIIWLRCWINSWAYFKPTSLHLLFSNCTPQMFGEMIKWQFYLILTFFTIPFQLHQAVIWFIRTQIIFLLLDFDYLTHGFSYQRNELYLALGSTYEFIWLFLIKLHLKFNKCFFYLLRFSIV